MIRIVSILLLTFYSLIAIGLSVSISFCGNRIVDIQFFQDAEYCCKTPKKCCSKINLSFELQEEVILNISLKTQPVDFLDFPPIYNFDFKKLYQSKFTNHNKFNRYHTKLITRFLYLKYCNLKICE